MQNKLGEEPIGWGIKRLWDQYISTDPKIVSTVVTLTWWWLRDDWSRIRWSIWWQNVRTVTEPNVSYKELNNNDDIITL